MRIRFAEGLDAVARDQLIERIDHWWTTFRRQADDLDRLFTQKSKWDLPAWMAENLGSIDGRLMWEFGAGTNGGHRLVITPESDHHLRPLTQLILDRAPQLPGWSFTGQRLEDAHHALLYASERTGVPLSTTTVKASLGEHGRIDVTVFFDDAQIVRSQRALDAAFLAIDYLVGEKCLNYWIGDIDLEVKPKKSLFRAKLADHSTPFATLPQLVARLIQQHRATLPSRPLFERPQELDGTIWKLEPKAADDYAAQADLFVGKSVYPPFWTAFRGDALFNSERFSNFGETFCYLKIDGSEGVENCEFEDKAGIEDAVDEILIPAGLGCQIGGGTGLRYSYVDMAVTELEPAIHLLRKRFATSGFPRRSWILFHDRDLSGEWVSLHADPIKPLLAHVE